MKIKNLGLRPTQERVDIMTNTTKMTKRDYFNRILGYVHDEDRDFILHEIELLNKKNSAERKPTAKQTENEGFKAAILAWMVEGEKYVLADVVKGVPAFVENGVSANRVTALMTQLFNEGKVIRETDKRKNYYSLA